MKRIFILLIFCLLTLNFFSCIEPGEITDSSYGCDFSFKIQNESSFDSDVRLYAAFSKDCSVWSASEAGAFSSGTESKTVKAGGTESLSAGYMCDGISSGEYISFVLEINGKYFTGFSEPASFYADGSEESLLTNENLEKSGIFLVYTKANLQNSGTLYYSKTSGTSDFTECSYDEASRSFSVKISGSGIKVE